MTESISKRPILVVDDEPEILRSLKDLLRREFDVHTATSGTEGMKILEERPIHLVMTDQRMPKMTGVEFLRKIKSEHPSAIRLIFTGYADIQAIIDAINQGNVFRYVAKPWDPDELMSVLRDGVKEYDRIVACEQLLQDLQTYQQQCLAFDRELRNGTFGCTLNGSGMSEVESLATSGNALLTRIEESLRYNRCKPATS